MGNWMNKKWECTLRFLWVLLHTCSEASIMCVTFCRKDRLFGSACCLDAGRFHFTAQLTLVSTSHLFMLNVWPHVEAPILRNIFHLNRETYRCHVGLPCRTCVHCEAGKKKVHFYFARCRKLVNSSLTGGRTQVSLGAVRKTDEQEVADGFVDAEIRQSFCIYEQRRDTELLLQQSRDDRRARPF